MARQKPNIQIPDPVLETRDALRDVKSLFSFYNNIVIGVFLLGFLVLLFTVIGLVIQSWQFNTTYQTERTQLQNQKELIKNTVEEQKIMIESQTDIEKKLDQLIKLYSSRK